MCLLSAPSGFQFNHDKKNKLPYRGYNSSRSTTPPFPLNSRKSSSKRPHPILSASPAGDMPARLSNHGSAPHSRRTLALPTSLLLVAHISGDPFSYRPLTLSSMPSTSNPNLIKCSIIVRWFLSSIGASTALCKATLHSGLAPAAMSNSTTLGVEIVAAWSRAKPDE